MPRPFRGSLSDCQISTTQEMGWAHYKNGALLAKAEGLFDVFLTTDQQLKYQQNLKGRKLAIVVLPTNRLPSLRKNASKINIAILQAQPGDYVEVEFD